ncbi:uncharacterized protein [Argopecten irradians]|uniref:uncharacterized protein n=1 Tax=Argopecten irradians TaxID=31199 RepID=UPI0037109E16
MDEVYLDDARLVFPENRGLKSKADAIYTKAGTTIDFCMEFQPEDIQPWPRLSHLTIDWTDTKTKFLEMEFPEEMAKLAADARRAKLLGIYRGYLFPEIYAADEFTRLVKQKLAEKRKGEKVARAKLLSEMEKATTEQGDGMAGVQEKVDEKGDEKDAKNADEKEVIKMEEVVLETYGTHKPGKQKTFLSCFCL